MIVNLQKQALAYDTRTDAGTRASVVIPTLNEAKNIERVLTELGLGKSGDPASQLHFFVADGGSVDDTCLIVTELARKHPNLTLIHNSRKKQGPGVNLAAFRAEADDDVLIRCDAHASYPEDFIEHLLATLASTGADSVVVPMDSVGDGCLQKAVAWVSDTIIGSGGAQHRGGTKSGWVIHGHHAAFKAESFRTVGGYKERYHPNEDAEFDARLIAAGGTIYLDADIRIKYHPRATFSALARQYFAYGAARALTMRDHPNSIRPRQVVVPANVVLLAISLAALPFTSLGVIWPALYIGGLTATSLAIAVDRGSLCGLFAGPAAGTMHLAWAAGFFSRIFNKR